MNVADTYEIEEHTALFTTLAERLLNNELPEGGENCPDRAHLLRLLSSLMPAVDKTARRAIIEQTAQRATPPKDLAMVLARDHADLAGPVLRSVPFTQMELIELVTRTGPAHHIEIAKRADLTLDVWLALARAAARRVRGSDIAQQPLPAASDYTAPKAQGDSPDFASASTHDARTATTPPHSETMAARPSPTRSLQEERAYTAECYKPADPIPTQDAPQNDPLHDTDDKSWRFETTRSGRIFRLSPNAHLAFGPGAHSLVGEYFASALQSRSAVPAPDDIGAAMANRSAFRDIVVETMVGQGPTRRWILRGRPRFSFPDGRFEGYSGVAQDMDADKERQTAPKNANELLDRMARAADRLASQTRSPELEDYAQTMRDCVEALKSMPMSFYFGDKSQDRHSKD